MGPGGSRALGQRSPYAMGGAAREGMLALGAESGALRCSARRLGGRLGLIAAQEHLHAVSDEVVGEVLAKAGTE